jgi:hypothetical protein
MPDGYNIGVNIGAAAGQSRMHVHVHLIPRYVGVCPSRRAESGVSRTVAKVLPDDTFERTGLSTLDSILTFLHEIEVTASEGVVPPDSLLPGVRVRCLSGSVRPGSGRHDTRRRQRIARRVPSLPRNDTLASRMKERPQWPPE